MYLKITEINKFKGFNNSVCTLLQQSKSGLTSFTVAVSDLSIHLSLEKLTTNWLGAGCWCGQYISLNIPDFWRATQWKVAQNTICYFTFKALSFTDWKMEIHSKLETMDTGHSWWLTEHRRKGCEGFKQKAKNTNAQHLTPHTVWEWEIHLHTHPHTHTHTEHKWTD